ncbi:major facilitator superfamily domain-containing protein [Kockovaella imperatae]|uniref:Major facilitator superfamily domain-containing protein n=1 Tax=Kockovaella imperatae TaxID=4999 RepID=A0A1Y1URU5_9TREE|nr:major facilitator superfamily domain-containing protein [Kockovaella imperatae]ORX40689.1 major facilitator superfamily domain-containing protein [Kockovaella imperatae]
MQPPIIQPMPRSPSPIPPVPLTDIALLHVEHSRSPPPYDQPSSSRPSISDDRLVPGKSLDIPWRALMPIQLYRIADASAYCVIFPFVTALVTSFNVPQDKIGLYSGLAEGSMMMMEAVAAPFWAKAADRYGRRAAMNFGYASSILPALMFGFCSGPWQLLFWRTLFGTMNPIGVIGKILASEICHPGNRAKVFAIFSPGFALGAMAGNLIGGEFSHPWHRLPAWLGGATELYRDWPYALPCVVLAVFGVLTVVYGFAELQETRPPKTHSDLSKSESEKASSKISYASAMKVPGFMRITVIFCFFQLSVLSWDGMASVWLYTQLDRGGLAMSVDIIGLLLAFNNFIYIFTSPYLLPRLQKRYGAVKTLRVCCLIYVLIALMMPLLSFLAGTARPLMWFMLFCYQTLRCVAGLAWPLSDMMTTGCFDDYPHLLATGSAVSLIAGAFGRAIGPGIAGWIYSISTEYESGTLGRQLPWVTILLISLPSVVLSQSMPSDAGGKHDSSGYEAVPMVDSARRDEEESDEETVALRVTGTDV